MNEQGSAFKALILGLGSMHGDDQFGWVVVDRIQARLPAGCLASKGSNALDWLSRLEGLQTLVVVDVSVSGSRPGTRRILAWPSQELVECSRLTSHGPGLVETLELAELFGWLPVCVRIHAVEGVSFTPGDDLGPALAHQVEPVLESILSELAALSGRAWIEH